MFSHHPEAMAPLAALPLLCVALLLSASAHRAAGRGSLREGFYSETCPRAEEIVRRVVERALLRNPGEAAGLLRLLFHDCFVRGCDASILLDATPTGEPVEKEFPANGGTLRGLDLVDDAKRQLERECPGTVSCADILAFASRDAAVLSGLPGYSVPAGRRDGRTSRAVDVPGNLAAPSFSARTLGSLFSKKGLSQEEMVILLGAHSIGGAHCGVFDYRLYNYRPGQPQDPRLDRLYADFLKLQCPKQGSLLGMVLGQQRVPFNPVSPLRLDNTYYDDLINGKGLLESDQALMGDAGTSSVVRQMAAKPDLWAKKFGEAMVKLGKVGVLTGEEGEVRTRCSSVN